jgi:hypothetical protein
MRQGLQHDLGPSEVAYIEDIQLGLRSKAPSPHAENFGGRFGSIFGLRPPTRPLSRVHRLITSNPVVLRGLEDEDPSWYRGRKACYQMDL